MRALLLEADRDITAQVVAACGHIGLALSRVTTLQSLKRELHRCKEHDFALVDCSLNPAKPITYYRIILDQEEIKVVFLYARDAQMTTIRQAARCPLQHLSSGTTWLDLLGVLRTLQAPGWAERVRLRSEVLTPREQEVLALIQQGGTQKQIALTLDLGVGSVKTYVRRIFQKVDVHTTAELRIA